MSLLFFDGYETYNIRRELTRIWTQLDDTDTSIIDLYDNNLYGKNSKSMIIKDSSTNHNEVRKTVNTNDNDFIIGFNLKIPYIQQEELSFEATPSSYASFFRIFDDRGSLVGGLGINPFWGKLFLIKSTSSSNDNNEIIYQTSENFLRIGSNYFIEMKGAVSSNATFVLKIDNETITTITNVDTVNPSGFNKRIRSLEFRPSFVGGSGTGKHWQILVDDIYICDSTGTKFNDFIGPSFVRKLKIKSEDTNQWSVIGASTSISAISDNDDTSFLTTTTTSASAVFSISANVSDISVVEAVKIETKIRKNTSIPVSAKEFIEVSGVTGRSSIEKKGESGFIRTFTIHERKPDNNDWSPNDINNLKFGIKKK